MEKAKVLKISELIHGARPLTAADSTVSDLRLPSLSGQTSKRCAGRSFNDSPSPQVLVPLDFAATVVGTVNLPVVCKGSPSGNSTFRCSNGSCFQFSDCSATICCDILDLDLNMIGERICVLAWNFVPIKQGGGFLEIVRWSFCELVSPRGGLEEISLSLTPSASGFDRRSSKSCHFLHGALEMVSPISVNPCSSDASSSLNTADSNHGTNASLRGFLARFLVCECRSSSSRESIHDPNNHTFTKPIIVYFYGSATSWHPAITKLIGNVVSISGLKKKLVCIRGEDSPLVYVTTENSCIRLSRMQKKIARISKKLVCGKGECGSYTGIVKGIYMQGMVVELDDEVWLLLTNQLLTAPHSLRVGALISVRNAHFVNPSFSWTKMLILGACNQTSIVVQRFSPLMAGCHILAQSRSMLGNFIEFLTLSARLWVLLLVTCFRKKFACMLSEKEMLGTNKKEGMIQLYCKSRLPSSVLLSSTKRHGVFMSLLNHESCSPEGHNADMKLVVPLHSFLRCCEAKWSRLDGLDSKKISCDGKSYHQPIRRIFSSKDIGIVLIGSLKISPSSGRLQLVDATGNIDVIIPDLSSSWNFSSNSIYEVVEYSLLIEGAPTQLDCSGTSENSFSCRTIFNFTRQASEVDLRVCAYFFLQNAACKNSSFYPCPQLGEDLERLKTGIYHLLYIAHKFPMLEKLQDDTFLLKTSSMYAEAVILNWNLVLLSKDSRDHLKNCMEHCEGGSYRENTSKRHKTGNASLIAFPSLVEIPCRAVQWLRRKAHSDAKSSEKQSCLDYSSHKIYSSTIREDSKNHSVVDSAVLRHTAANLTRCGNLKPNVRKVLLEFKPESFYKFQLLQIGSYYITEHDEKACFCTNKDFDSVGGVKIPVPAQRRLWSVSFTPEEVNLKSTVSNGHSLDNSRSRSDESNDADCIELYLHVPIGESLKSSSDVSLFMPANWIGIVSVNKSEEKESITKLADTPKENADNNGIVPEGNLVSFRGHVVAVHKIGEHVSSRNLGDSLVSRLFRKARSSCFHVSVDRQIVKIVSSMSEIFFPPGFGCGVDATFHRVLELGGRNKWMLTPVSFVVINTISVARKITSEECLSPVSKTNCPKFFNSGLISELDQLSVCKFFQISCRIVSTNILVFEKFRKGPRFSPKFDPTQLQFDITIAGFVLDDGSSQCCCWANGERAAILLKLHDLLPEKRALGNNTLKFDKVKIGNKFISCPLRRILEKHDRITVKNFGSLFDSDNQDPGIFTSSSRALTRSDEDFLKSLVFNTCAGTSWTIVGSLMDPDTLGKQQNLMQTELITSSMKNIWANEVRITNTLKEARTIIQELLSRYVRSK